MLQLREKKPRAKRSIKSHSKKFYKIYYLGFEGEKTEDQYFCGISNYKKQVGIPHTIRIEALKREQGDGGSHPKVMLNKMVEYKNNQDDIDKNDEFWLICDIDKYSHDKKTDKDYLKLVREAKKEGINLGITNPNFEFWLLLHFYEVKLCNQEDLYENAKKSKNGKRFIEKELVKVLSSYNKSRIVFSDYMDRIGLAIEQEKCYEADAEKAFGKLSSNIGGLIERMKNSE